MHPDDVLALLDRVTVVTVTYNSSHCLPALAGPLSACPHVVVVDNASADESVAQARMRLPRADVLPLPENLGYGAANNRGIERARTKYVLLLNPDVLVRAEEIAALVREAEVYPDAVMWVPQLVDGAGRVELNYSWPRARGAPASGAADGPLCVGYACAAVMLIDRERMAPFGFFDTRFFLYYEDEDLCLRAFQARAPVVVLPQVRMVHLARGSVRGPRPLAAEYWRGWHHAQSKIRFVDKHQGTGAAERLRRGSLRNAVVTVGARSLLFSPRLFARSLGRWRGLRALAAQPASPVAHSAPWRPPHPPLQPGATSHGPRRLTVGILTFNEARRIARCLASVAFADEIVVVDSGSTDDTVAIARAAGAQVHVHADWQGFAVQRNRVLQHATGDSIFFVDADEEVTPALRASVQAAVASGVQAVGTIRWLVVAFGRELPQFRGQAKIERLFPCAQLRGFSGLVHEKAELRDPDLPRRHLDGALRHTSRETVHDSLNKLTQYAMLGAAKRAAAGKRGGAWRGIAAASAIFVRLYLLRLGFLGGGAGFLFCLFIALESFFRYAALQYDRGYLRSDVGR